MDTKSPSPAPNTASPAARKSPRKRVIGAIVALAALGVGGYFAVHAYHYQTTDDAYVTGHLYQISPQVGGQIAEVLVVDNQVVKAGQPLVRLNPLQFDLAAQKARNEAAQAEAKVKEMTAAVVLANSMIAESEAKAKQAASAVEQTKAQLVLAKLTLDRQEQLFKAGGVISQADLDSARSAYQVAVANEAANESALVAANSMVDASKAGLLPLEASIEAAQAGVASSESSVKDAHRVVSYATIVAPSDGRVGAKSVEVGNYVTTGQTLMSIAGDQPWIVANFKETQLTHMRPGQRVDFTLDVLPSLELHGTVQSISPASGSTFALLPPDNSTGNFTKVVQRVPVKIVLDTDSLKVLGDRLRLGLSVEVEVRVR